MIAHLISVSRALLGFFLFFANVKQRAVIIFIAAWTDFLDGYVARYLQTQSAFGQFLDPLADKIFTACLYFVFVRDGLVPAWVMALFLSRDVAIVIGYIVARRHDSSYAPKPPFIGKLNTALQVTYPFAILIGFFPSVFMWSAVTTTAITGALYFKKFITQWKTLKA